MHLSLVGFRKGGSLIGVLLLQSRVFGSDVETSEVGWISGVWRVLGLAFRFSAMLGLRFKLARFKLGCWQVQKYVCVCLCLYHQYNIRNNII